MVSPRSRMLAQAASMPPVPVAERGSVMALEVWYTSRNISATSSITWKKSGSKCPTTGKVMA